MKAITSISILKKELNTYKTENKIIGFVPTMGALHQGHLSLIEKAKNETDIVVCSIFVNPTQFNDPSDYEKYPRTTENDITLLQKIGCDIIFLPSVDEIYPEPDTQNYQFNGLEDVMEGKFRPGHFCGVASVVKRLFEIVEPNKAFFGEKDFQQLAIIRSLVKQFQLPIDIIGCPIIRENDGLAMSSRNMRLSEPDRKDAANINKIIAKAIQQKNVKPIDEIRKEVGEAIAAFPQMKLEYFEIVDRDTLQSINNWGQSSCLIACIAVFVGEIRLIDNMIIP